MFNTSRGTNPMASYNKTYLVLVTSEGPAGLNWVKTQELPLPSVPQDGARARAYTNERPKLPDLVGPEVLNLHTGNNNELFLSRLNQINHKFMKQQICCYRIKQYLFLKLQDDIR